MDDLGQARLLAVEVLLADPEALGNDALEADLYLLRHQLQTPRRAREQAACRPPVSRGQPGLAVSPRGPVGVQGHPGYEVSVRARDRVEVPGRTRITSCGEPRSPWDTAKADDSGAR